MLPTRSHALRGNASPTLCVAWMDHETRKTTRSVKTCVPTQSVGTSKIGASTFSEGASERIEASVNHQLVANDIGELREYRPVSNLAVISMALGIASLFAALFPRLLPFCGLAVGFGIVTWWRLRVVPEPVTGRGAALAGTIISGLAMGVGTSVAWWGYLAEAPQDVVRLDLGKLVAKPSSVLDNGPRTLSPNAKANLGRLVCLHGHAFPENATHVSKVIVSKDGPTGTFGTTWKPEQSVLVQIKDGTLWAYDRRRLAVLGVLELNPDFEVDASQPVFKLTNARIRAASSSW